MEQSKRTELLKQLDAQKKEILELLSSLNLVAFVKLSLLGVDKAQSHDLLLGSTTDSSDAHPLVANMIDEIKSLMPLHMRIYPLVDLEVYELLEPNIKIVLDTSG